MGFSPVPRIRSYRFGPNGESYDPLDQIWRGANPYADQEFGRPLDTGDESRALNPTVAPAVGPSPGPAVGPSPIDPERQRLMEGQTPFDVQPQIPPSPTDQYRPEMPEEIAALSRHAAEMPEKEKQPWWKTAAGLALSGVNLAPAQIGAQKLLYGDYPRKLGEWQEKGKVLTKAAEEAGAMGRSESDFYSKLNTTIGSATEKGWVPIDPNAPDFDPDSYEGFANVAGQRMGKLTEAVGWKDLQQLQPIPREQAIKMGYGKLLKPGQEFLFLDKAIAEKGAADVIEGQKPVKMTPGETLKDPKTGAVVLSGGERQTILSPTQRLYGTDPATGEMTERAKHPITERAPRATGTRTTNPYQATINQIEAEYRRGVAALRKDARGKTTVTDYGSFSTDGMEQDAVDARMQELEDLREDAYRTQVPEDHWPESRKAALSGTPPPGSAGEISSWEELEVISPRRQASIPPPPGPAIPPPPDGAQPAQQAQGAPKTYTMQQIRVAAGNMTPPRDPDQLASEIEANGGKVIK